jgi:hypothetical protein
MSERSTWLRRLGDVVSSAGLLGALLASVSSARASLLVYEPFAYEPDTVLDGVAATGLNLTGSYVADSPAPFLRLEVEGPGLGFGSLSGVPGVAGNRLSQANGVSSATVTVDIAQDVIVDPGSAIFWSALFTFDDSSNGTHLAHVGFKDDDSGDELGFGEPSVGIQALRVSADTAATGQLASDSEGSAFTNGQTLLLVGRYVNSAAADGDLLDLIVYDTADALTLPASFDPADAGAQVTLSLSGLDIDLAKISSISFSIRGADNNFIDELRIGTTYASVLVPEPATGVLVGLGLAALTSRRTVRQVGHFGVNTYSSFTPSGSAKKTA